MEKISVCKVCGNIDSQNPCAVCSDPRRDPSVLVVVEDASQIGGHLLVGHLGAGLDQRDIGGRDARTLGELDAREAVLRLDDLELDAAVLLPRDLAVPGILGTELPVSLAPQPPVRDAALWACRLYRARAALPSPTSVTRRRRHTGAAG